MALRHFGGAVACLALVAGAAHAQGAAPNTEKSNTLNVLKSDPAKNAALFEFSYGAPESPVLPLVGIGGDQITKVESFRKLGVSLLGGSNSDEPTAVALDFSPYWLMRRDAVSLQDYRKFGTAERAFARTKGAVAVSEGKEGKFPSSVVLSLSTKLWTDQDPLATDTFETCIKGPADGPAAAFWKLADEVEAAGIANLPPPASPEKANEYFDEGVEAKAKELKPQLEAAYKACSDETAKLLARRSSFDVGVGLRLNGTPGKLEQLDHSGTIVWATYATGVLGEGFRSQVRGVAHGRYTFSETAFDDLGRPKGDADSGMLVVGLENMPSADGNDPFRWNLQAGWNRQESVDPTTKTKDYWRYLAVAQARVSDRMWLKATFGRVEGRGIDDDTYVLFGFSFAPDWGPSAIQKLYEKPRY